MSQIIEDLEGLQGGSKIIRYITANDEKGFLSTVVEEINAAIIDYQLSLHQDLYNQIGMLIVSFLVYYSASTSDTCCREKVLSLRDFAPDLLLTIVAADQAELEKLARAGGAGFRPGQPDAGCFPGTRIDVLNTLEIWVNSRDSSAQRVYWLNGHAGSGKSTIAYTFCERLYANGQLGASFFCSRDFSERSDVKLIFPTLAFQLACRHPSFCTHLLATLRRPDFDSKNMSMASQLAELLVLPLRKSDISTTIAIDALDELKDEEQAPVSTILFLLAKVIDQIPLVNFFVTSRAEAPIRAGFRDLALSPQTGVIRLHEVDQSDVDSDISLYINSRLSDLARSRSCLDVSETWPSKDQVDILVAKSARYFIFAFTCVKMISSPPPSDPVEVLTTLVNSTSSILEGQSRINDLYAHVLTTAFSPKTTITTQMELKLILSAVILSYNPLNSQSLSDLLDITRPRLAARLGSLHSLLLVPSSDSEAVRIHHKSFHDYLTNRKLCTNGAFYIDPTIYHAQLAISCFEYMKKHLRNNICGLPRYAMNSVLPLDERRKSIGESLEYACRSWAQHVYKAIHSGEQVVQLLSALLEFLRLRQVLWMEVLSLLDDIHHSLASLQDVREWLQKVSRTFMGASERIDEICRVRYIRILFPK